MNGTMWKTAIILFVAVFTRTRGKMPNEMDCHRAIESIDNAKELITRHYINVQQRVSDLAETVYGDLIGLVDFLANEMNDTVKKINDEVEKLFENSLERTKQKCKIYSDNLGGAALAVRENMEDCAKFAIWTAEEKFSKAFNCLQNAKRDLDYQKRLARICRNNDYSRILDDTYIIISNTSANVTAEYEAYINTMDDINFFDECINDKTTGYKRLSNAAPFVIANTERCITTMPIHEKSTDV